MKLPNYQDYYPYILKFGDKRRTADEYLELICEEMKIPEDAKSVRNDSGELTIRNRLRWAIHYLRRANLMDKPERAKYIINSRGKEIRKKYKFDITNKTLEQFEEYKKFIKNSSTVITSKEKIDSIEVLTPSEKIENIITQLNEEAKEDPAHHNLSLHLCVHHLKVLRQLPLDIRVLLLLFEEPREEGRLGHMTITSRSRY